MGQNREEGKGGHDILRNQESDMSVCWFGKLRATRATRFGSPKRRNATKEVPRHSFARALKYQKYLEKAINTIYSLRPKSFLELASLNTERERPFYEIGFAD